MNLLLIALIGIPLALKVFGINTSIAMGLSVPNLLIYVGAVALALRFAITRDFKLEMTGVLGCFVLMITYSVLTMLVADYVIDYPRYSFVQALGPLKNRVVDFLVYFAVFFYGVRTAKDSGAVLRGFLFCVTLANICSCLDGFGIVRFGMYVQLTDNRLQGFVGEHNQYGAWLVVFFPALIAQALGTRNRPERLFWFGSAALSIAALLATASRGGVVAALFGVAVGLYVFRRQISFDQIAKWAIGGAFALVGLIAAVSVRYGSMIYSRFVAKSSAVDDVDVSSGRTEFWAAILQTMNEHPITYLTGYGWEVYNVMAFRKVSHNEYLTILFDIGLIGLAAFLAIIGLLIREVSQTAARAERPWRAHLMAFVFGFVSLATAVIFVNLYDPWPYVWAYAGLMARMAITVREAAPNRRSHQVAQGAPRRADLAPARLDAYGWSSRRKAT